MTMDYLIGAVIGLILGVVGCYILLKKIASDTTGKVESLLNEQIEKYKADNSELANKLEDQKTKNQQLNLELTRYQSELKGKEDNYLQKEHFLKKQIEENKQTHEKAIKELRDAFTAMSAEALRNNNQEFLKLAQENFNKHHEVQKTDFELKQKGIETLLSPLQESLKLYQDRLQLAETEQNKALGKVTEQLKQLGDSSKVLSDETQKFRSVLSNNQTRGKWGEETLRRVVESAGLTHFDFTEQEGADVKDLRPDLIVHLPGNRKIIVDAKTPEIENWGEITTGDEVERKIAFSNYSKKFKQTVTSLAQRKYTAIEGAFDYIILFVPAESLFSAALEGDRELLIWSQNQGILIATPSSLAALLKAVAVSWQMHDQTKHAQEIAKTSDDLFKRVTKFIEHLKNIGNHLAKTNNAFNDAVSSYGSRILPMKRQLVGLGINNDKELPELSEIESDPIQRLARLTDNSGN
jgi:DNA recombination protein RmuC